MAIIYTYPVKSTPVIADKLLISDSADSNKTKQITIDSLSSVLGGVSKIKAGNNINISPTRS